MSEEYIDITPIYFGGSKSLFSKKGFKITDFSGIPIPGETPKIPINDSNGIYTINKQSNNQFEVTFECGDSTIVFSFKDGQVFSYKKGENGLVWTCAITKTEHSEWINGDFSSLDNATPRLKQRFGEIAEVFYKSGYLKGVLEGGKDDVFLQIDGRNYNFLISISARYVLTRYRGVKNGFSDPQKAELHSRLANSRCFHNSITLSEKDFKGINLISIREEVKEADLVRKSYYFIDIDESSPVIGRFLGFRSDGKPMFYTGNDSIWMKNDDKSVKFYNIEENDQV